MRLEIVHKALMFVLSGILAPSLIHAGTYHQGDLADLARQSELVLLGEVREVKGQSGGYWLATIRVEEVFKGSAKGTVTMQAGGTAEDLTSASVGQRLILFLQSGTDGDTAVKHVAWHGRGCMSLILDPKEFEGVLVVVPAAVELPPAVTPVKAPLRADGAALITIESLRRLVRATLPGPASSRNPALPNNAIKLTVHPVTHLACASCAPARPAAYRVR